MPSLNEEIAVRLSGQEDMDLAEKLLQEVGEISGLKFCVMPEYPSEINPQFQNYTEIVRGMIRVAALQREDFKWHNWHNHAREEGDDGSAKFLSGIVIGRNAKNQRIFRGNLEDSPEKQHVKALLKEPINFHYQWHDVAYWNLDKFQELQKQITPGGILVLQESGILLFSDELKKLSKGEEVITREIGGLNNFGFISNELDIYQVRDGNLYRVWAHLSD